MTQESSKADEIINYSFLLLPHIVCADAQIHNKEAQALHELAQQSSMGKRTIEEMEKILAQDENSLSVEDIANKIPPGEQHEAMRQMLAIAYIDGFFSPLEREMVDLVAEIWNWRKQEVELIIEEAESSSTFQIGDKEETKQLEPVFGDEYDDAIQLCANVAAEDYQFALPILEKTDLALQYLEKGIQQQLEIVNCRNKSKNKAETATEVANQLENTRQSLTVGIKKEIESVRESLAAKQRALNHFSIAFIGKTKAGKSTLHAIVTGGGWDAIGVGKQRTTRLNRVYEWKNIRIIDTPGIGAPGGKTDEEIAKSVIEESDVICYILTNDSVQETEFEFLKILKEKAKPLIILLNVKKNLRDTRRLEYFLKNPDKPFNKTGKNDLAGHIERIRRYAKQYYGNDYFDIIPVMLLAAQLSREKEHQQNKEKLFKASRMQDFLDSIRVSLVENGTIRRSQTLLGSTVSAIDKPDKWVTQQIQIYQELTKTLKKKQKTIKRDIRKAANDNREYLNLEVQTIFQEAFGKIRKFSIKNWNVDETRLNMKWEKKIKSLNFDERLKNVFQQSSEKFQAEIQEILEEVGSELELLVKLKGGDFKLIQQDSNSFKNLLRIGGGIMGVAGVVLTFFAPPIGIAIGIVGTAISFVTRWFKSKEQKQREASEKISDSLRSQLDDYQYKTLQQAEQEFTKYSNSVANSINNYFEELITGLEGIAEELNKAKTKLDNNANYLNRAYAKRIIDWSLGKYEPLNDNTILKTIAKVKRDFGKTMTIETKSEIKINKSQEEINLVLQEDISINPIDLKPIRGYFISINPIDLKPINETNLFN